MKNFGVRNDEVRKKGICKNCSYFDFCYINELEEEE